MFLNCVLTVYRKNKDRRRNLFAVEFECPDTQLDKIVNFYSEIFSVNDIVEVVSQDDNSLVYLKRFVSGLPLGEDNQ